MHLVENDFILILSNKTKYYVNNIPSIISWALDVALPSMLLAIHLILPESLSRAPKNQMLLIIILENIIFLKV